MRFVVVPEDDLKAWGPRVAALEAHATYPLGDDRFAIDHGVDYFAFFRRMGRTTAHLAVDDDDQVMAVAVQVLRDLPGGPAWYLCDLKVHPAAQGRALPLRMFTRSFVSGFRTCRRGYAVSMNPGDGSPNRVVRMLQRIRQVPIDVDTQVRLYSLSADELQRFASTLTDCVGPRRLLSLQGKKDIVLQSTQAPMNLWHVQHGPLAEEGNCRSTFVDGGVHMFSAVDGGELDAAARAAGFSTTTTATVLHSGMPDVDFSMLLTSDI